MSVLPAAPVQPARSDTGNRWLGVVALLTIVAISYVDRVNASVLITDRAFTDHFGITGDRVMQGALTTMFLVGYGIALFFSHRSTKRCWAYGGGCSSASQPGQR